MAATDFHSIIKSGDEDRLISFLYSEEFESDPLEWFSYSDSPLITASDNTLFLELIVDRLHELEVLKKVCNSDIAADSHSPFFCTAGKTPLHFVIAESKYSCIAPLLKYPECWSATTMISTNGQTAISTGIRQACSSIIGLRRPMEFSWLEKLLGYENPYAKGCLVPSKTLDTINPIYEVLEYIESLGPRHVNWEALTKCKELIELRISESGSFTKKAV